MSYANALKKNLTETKQTEKPLQQPKEEKTSTGFDYFMVLDFEATCSDTDPKFVSEIIEFPIVIINAKNGERVAEFREYVRPVVNKTLTKFCTTLTGIEQKTVDEAETFPTVFSHAQQFCEKFHADHPGAKTIFITCGDWDLLKMLPNQARLSQLDIPSYFTRWINIKQPFRQYQTDFMGRKSGGFGMASMLRDLKLPLIGRHHSGLDDSRNIASITYDLVKKGINMEQFS